MKYSSIMDYKDKEKTAANLASMNVEPGNGYLEAIRNTAQQLVNSNQGGAMYLTQNSNCLWLLPNGEREYIKVKKESTT